jgi:hypothetical protein
MREERIKISNLSQRQSLPMLKRRLARHVDGVNPTESSLKNKSNAKNALRGNWQN